MIIKSKMDFISEILSVTLGISQNYMLMFSWWQIKFMHELNFATKNIWKLARIYCKYDVSFAKSHVVNH